MKIVVILRTVIAAAVCIPSVIVGQEISPAKNIIMHHGGIVRMDTTQKTVYLVFTGHEFADGGTTILSVLQRHAITASFFFTGDFYRNAEFSPLIKQLHRNGHYLGAHSDKHLLYCTWENRDSLLVTKEEFIRDVTDNYSAMAIFGIAKEDAPYFMPPYEWYNKTISDWSNDIGLRIINFTPGTSSNADYTIPAMANYVPSDSIFVRILRVESTRAHGLNGFLLLSHIGTDDQRTDKFYFKLDALIAELKKRGYTFSKL
ncbi:MAG: polysaccharide deacetylase family protein [Bacteroidota bacterium]